jgi:hypothetical protein
LAVSMGNQNKRTVDIGQTNQIAELRESNNAWSATSFLSKNKTRSVNEPRSSGSLRISDMTLMELCPLLALSGHRFWGISGHRDFKASRLLLTQSGHAGRYSITSSAGTSRLVIGGNVWI